MAQYIINERGYFWRSEIILGENQFIPEEGTYGTLLIQADGTIILELDGTIGETDIPFKNVLKGDNKSFSISGLLKRDSSYVRLLEATQNGGAARTDALSFQIFNAERCLKGPIYIDDHTISDLRIVHVPLLGYENWLWTKTPEITRSGNNVTINQKLNPNHTISLTDGEISLDFRISIDVKDENDCKALIRDNVWIRYKFTTEKSVQNISTTHRWLEDLLILLTNCEHDLNWPSVSKDIQSEQFTVYWHRNRRPNRPIGRHQIWLTYPQIAENFHNIIKTWRQRSLDGGFGFVSYLSTRRGVHMYTEHLFASYMWGLEGHHYSRFPQDVRISSTERQKRVLAAFKLASCDLSKKDRAWAKQTLSRSISKNLDDRLTEIFESLPIGLEKHQIHKFAMTCRELRNHLSHGAYTTDGPYKSPENLMAINRALGHLYHLRLLFDLGVSAAAIQRIVYSSFQTFDILSTLAMVGIKLPIPEHLAPFTTKQGGSETSQKK